MAGCLLNFAQPMNTSFLELPIQSPIYAQALELKAVFYRCGPCPAGRGSAGGFGIKNCTACTPGAQSVPFRHYLPGQGDRIRNQAKLAQSAMLGHTPLNTVFCLCPLTSLPEGFDLRDGEMY